MSLGKLYSTHARLDCTDHPYLANATYIVKSSMNMTMHEARHRDLRRAIGYR